MYSDKADVWGCKANEMTEQAEKEFEEWEEKCTCSLGWNSEGKRCVIHFDKNCPFHYPDSELAKLKEAHSRQQEKIDRLREGLVYAINELEHSGLCFDHPTIVKLQKLLKEVEG